MMIVFHMDVSQKFHLRTINKCVCTTCSMRIVRRVCVLNVKGNLNLVGVFLCKSDPNYKVSLI